MTAPCRVLVILGAMVAAGFSLSVDAGAAVRAGSAEDPVDALGQADVATVEVRYDEAGAIELLIRFHEAVPDGGSVTADWIVTPGPPSGGCSDTRQGLAGLVELASGEATLTYSEVSENADPVQIEIPAQRTLSPDRRDMKVTARSGTLAGRSFACSQLALSSGDEVQPFALTALPSASPAPGPGPSSGVGGRVTDMRVARGRLSFAQRHRTVTVVLRALVCGPPRTRFVVVIREARRRVGRRSFTPDRRHRYSRRQRLRCQEHRFSWRFRSRPSGSYEVRARLALTFAAPRVISPVSNRASVRKESGRPMAASVSRLHKRSWFACVVGSSASSFSPWR